MSTVRSALRMGLALLAGLPACSSDSAVTAVAADAGADTDAHDAGGAVDSWPHALIISIDGLHDLDVDRYVAAHPASTLAELARTGVRFSHAMAPFPSGSLPGALALLTGGTARSTGVYFDVAYDRALAPAGSDCSRTGAIVDFTATADRDPTAADGGGGLDPARLPRDPARGCQPVMPHAYLRVNTIFEVALQEKWRTAWIDPHLSGEIAHGPSGEGVLDLDASEGGAMANQTPEGARAYDARNVQALLNQINGQDSRGAGSPGIPALFGMSFLAVDVAQSAPGGGYLDTAGTPGPALAAALDATDAALGQILAAVKAGARNLWGRTTVFVTAARGHAPIDPQGRRVVSPAVLRAAAEAAKPGVLAQLATGDVALMWLNDATAAGAVADALTKDAATNGVAQVLAGDALKARLPDAATDSRAPDLVVLAAPGVIYGEAGALRPYGGDSDEDRHVPLLVAGGWLKPAVVTTPVETRQVAASALDVLGIPPSKLTAVKQEMTATLPAVE